MRTRATITLAAVLLTTLTACSSDDDTSAGTKPTPAARSNAEQPAEPAPDAEAAALSDAVKAYTKAYFAGDADTAHGMLSKRCQEKAEPTVFGAVVEQAAKEYGPDHPATDVKADVSGELARVSYKVEGLPKFDQEAQPWAREGGAWKYDAC